MPGTKLHPQHWLHFLLNKYIWRVRIHKQGLRPEEASMGGNIRSGQGGYAMNRQMNTYPAFTPGQHSITDLPGCPYWSPVNDSFYFFHAPSHL